jgi:hypothetical protein
MFTTGHILVDSGGEALITLTTGGEALISITSGGEALIIRFIRPGIGIIDIEAIGVLVITGTRTIIMGHGTHLFISNILTDFMDIVTITAFIVPDPMLTMQGVEDIPTEIITEHQA